METVFILLIGFGGLFLLVTIITVIVYAFRPKGGTGEVKNGESTNYKISDMK